VRNGATIAGISRGERKGAMIAGISRGERKGATIAAAFEKKPGCIFIRRVAAPLRTPRETTSEENTFRLPDPLCY
jgi:hypothetical protein